MPCVAVSLLSCLIWLTLCAGCTWILPANVGATLSAERSISREVDQAIFYTEEGLENGLWLEVQRTNEPGTVGGYISQNNPHRGALILLLSGASTFHPEGAERKAQIYHRDFLVPFQEEGYLTWSLVVRECGAAYGQGDLADTLEAIDWLQLSGNAELGVERLYVIGYSNGGTLAVLANRHRRADAFVSISGITQPDQFEALWSMYMLISGLFPENTGLCQMRSTLDYYGPPGSPNWDSLDSVRHLDEFMSPMLVVHGAADFVFLFDNSLALQVQYEQRVAAGDPLPQIEFMLLPDGDHFTPPENPEVIARILTFLGQFEP